MSEALESWHARIEAAPADLELRLVFADWLVERGDPMGEFIQLECRALREPQHADAEGWRRRAAELRAQHGDAWWGPAAVYGIVRGGLIEGVGRTLGMLGTLDHLQRVAPALVAVDLFGRRSSDEDDRIASHPVWRRVRQLQLSGEWCSGMIRALDADGLPNLERVCASSLGRFGAEHLLTSLQHAAPRLEQLDLPSLRTESATFLELARWTRTVTLLNLYDNELRPAGARALASGTLLEGVRELRLGHTRIGTDGLASLASSNRLARLERLELRNTNLGGDGLSEALSSLASAAGRLVSLELMGAALSPADIDALGESRWPSLRELSLQDCRLGDDGVVRLLGSPLRGRLEALNLRGDDLTDAAALRLSTAKLPALRLLNLEGNPLTDAGLDALRASPSLERTVITAGKLTRGLVLEARNDRANVWLGSTSYESRQVIRR